MKHSVWQNLFAKSLSTTVLVFSLCLGTARGEITVATQDECFKMEVDKALAAIRASSATLKGEIDEMSAAVNYQIVISLVKGGSFTAWMGEQSVPDLGQLVTIPIGWDPDIASSYQSWQSLGPVNSSRRYSDGLCIDVVASLAHELHHAYDKMLHGAPNASTVGNTHITSFEAEAVNAENLYRSGAGLCLRHTYGREVLPGVPVENSSCSGYEATCNVHISECRKQQGVGCCVISGCKDTTCASSPIELSCKVPGVTLEICDATSDDYLMHRHELIPTHPRAFDTATPDCNLGKPFNPPYTLPECELPK
jgi:hypothetical protein